MKVAVISHTERNIQCLHMAMFTITPTYMQKVGICKKEVVAAGRQLAQKEQKL